MNQGDVYFVPRAYPHHIEVVDAPDLHFAIFFDQPTPGDIGYKASASAYSREVLAATFNVHIDDLPDFPFTPSDPLVVTATTRSTLAASANDPSGRVAGRYQRRAQACPTPLPDGQRSRATPWCGCSAPSGWGNVADKRRSHDPVGLAPVWPSGRFTMTMRPGTVGICSKVETGTPSTADSTSFGRWERRTAADDRARRE